jgi:hypothetical protein
MSHLSSETTPCCPAVRLLLSARLGIVLGLSLALWLVLGGSLVGASRLPGSVNGFVKPAGDGLALANDAGGEAPYNFAPQRLGCSSAITVTNANDSGDGSLRQAIADVCDGGRITFANSYTIYLTATLEITRQLTVDGETHAVTVSGDSGGNGTPNVRVFSITSSGVATLTHLRIVSGTVGEGDEGCPGQCGGGIYNQGTLTVQNSTLSGNSATGNGSDGGGIDNEGTLTVTNSTLSDNSVHRYGGGINNSGTLTVQNSTLSGNSSEWGGGIDNNYGTLTVQNSTLSGNLAWGGGGIYNGGTLTVQNSTLSGNSSEWESGEGGGIDNWGTLTMTNTLIAHNPPGGDCWGSVATNDYNLIEDTGIDACDLSNGVNGNIIGVDPRLGSLADHGGGTQTHALLRGSPAIDAGGSTCLATDQRGIPRPQGAACDIGAFEKTASDEWDIFLPVIQRLAH